MADRAGGPSEAAKQLVRKIAGEAFKEKVNEATSQLKKQGSKVPAEAWFVISRWRWLAYELAERLSRGERESAQVRAGRQQKEVRSGSASGLQGFVLGALLGSGAVYLLMKQPWK